MLNLPGKLFALGISLAVTSVIANESRTKQDLTEVQQELKKSQKNYQQQRSNIEALRTKLKAQELDIAKNAKALSLTERGIAENQQQQYTLQSEAKSLESKKQRLQKLLASQLKSAYMTGSHDYSKMLLNQEQSATLERTISYYDYFNKARINQLEELKQIFSELAENQQQLKRKQEQLAALKQQQQQRQAALIARQEERQTHLQELNAALQQTAQAIDYLKENEQTLIATLEELAKIQQPEEVVLEGLAQNKGKLQWPSKGRLRHRFGQSKHAGMSWKGVVIQAQAGTPVNSIKQGQVVYADWLNGFGWVMVVDHGEGFMSLYGHTQTLLKDVGDLVNTGETIALVGQSGGQIRSGLYFEIRHKGSAVDPVKWCKAS
ncbi:murein hydrolase activator EnvC family protein [Pseudoalteromonas sp. S16_S37]|uniref:murein hydrolase activator EnvC family protein n=1 Tax=Pseudoalteromonas sp. S16_S37 TaxID=2720228 RepID=UPI00167FE56D|nr:peptidoglycan DD-metalloendopeptidase family protein [Pseudoalteromonas sp. S16_S37]MBD1581730.1 peptidoglycan DD-metalloendopeptidase family protein [Pseudoalteromonas sp. S16_S37]